MGGPCDHCQRTGHPLSRYRWQRANRTKDTTSPRHGPPPQAKSWELRAAGRCVAGEVCMANFNIRVPENVPGEFFVDSTCIDCDTCRQLASETFGETAAYAFVHAQPPTAEAMRQALRALLACPTGSIGTVHRHDTHEVRT